jgi:hypothetical protein
MMISCEPGLLPACKLVMVTFYLYQRIESECIAAVFSLFFLHSCCARHFINHLRDIHLITFDLHLFALAIVWTCISYFDFLLQNSELFTYF